MPVTHRPPASGPRSRPWHVTRSSPRPSSRWACLLLLVAGVVFFSAVHGFARVFLEGLQSVRLAVDSGVHLWTRVLGVTTTPNPYVVYGCFTTLLVIACTPLQLPVLAARVMRRGYRALHDNIFSFVLIVFVWVCVARANGLSDPQISSLQSVLRHERRNSFLQDQFRMASMVFESWTKVIVVYEVHCDDGTIGDLDIVGDLLD
ncbi:hypothetical protein AB1Y20_005808 [Prymnesium parvum]|uniref:Autophagy-related protein 9 n=1 Tax=Prymnesium parvum TaxID=97485 RepID=A0AB34J2T6_PRYPA